MRTNTEPIDNLHFIKLGGSLITDKHTPQTPHRDVIASLAQEIHSIRDQFPGLKLILGHGSGSFGHVPAKRYNTRQGVASPRQWQGFTEVWWQAASLNHLVMSALHQTGLPAVSFPASASAVTQDGRLQFWNPQNIVTALSVGLLPVVYGDVVFDTIRGGTILSTEDLFSYLAHALRPNRIYLAGVEPGVWADYPQCTRLYSEITPPFLEAATTSLIGSNATDVTGGMVSKVKAMLVLVSKIPGLQVRIFSGNPPSNLTSIYQGKPLGTLIVQG